MYIVSFKLYKGISTNYLYAYKEGCFNWWWESNTTLSHHNNNQQAFIAAGQQAYYWKNKGEVDFILKEKNQDLTAINVSYTDEIPEREIKALLEFKKEFKNTTKLILITKEIEKTEQGITLIPLWKWLLTEKH